MSKLQAYQWWCADDICDCTQYMIERLTPHPVTRGFVNRERVWEGRFVTLTYEEPSQERAVRVAAFRAAARKYGIELDKDLFGERDEASEPEGDRS